MEAKSTHLGAAQDPPCQTRRREGRGSWRGKKRGGKNAGRRDRGRGRLHSQSRCFFLGPMISWVVALHTVLDTAEPVTLCWAAVIRSVKLWPDISAAPPPPLPLGSRRGLGPPSAGGPPPPTAPPTPTGSFSACRPGAGLRAARWHPAGKEPARVTRGVRHGVGHSPAPASAQPTPSLVSWSRAGQEGQAAAGKWRRQAPPRSFPGCLGSRDSGAAPPSPSPAPFPSLSSSTPALPRSAREERGGARALRDGTRPAGATGGPPGGSALRAASRDAPCQQVAPGGTRGSQRGGEAGEGRRVPRAGGELVSGVCFTSLPLQGSSCCLWLKPTAWQKGGAATFTAWRGEGAVRAPALRTSVAESTLCWGIPAPQSRPPGFKEKENASVGPFSEPGQQASPYCENCWSSHYLLTPGVLGMVFVGSVLFCFSHFLERLGNVTGFCLSLLWKLRHATAELNLDTNRPVFFL